MLKWAVKRYIISKVNSLLAKQAVGESLGIISAWVRRLGAITACLEETVRRCADGKLSPEEIDETVAEIERIVREW